MGILKELVKLIVFNICFGIFKFIRLFMGFKIVLNSF